MWIFITNDNQVIIYTLDDTTKLTLISLPKTTGNFVTYYDVAYTRINNSEGQRGMIAAALESMEDINGPIATFT